MTDAEIAGIMGWRGPGAYSAAAMRKVRRCIDQAVREEREACARTCMDRGERNRVAAGKPNGDRDEFYCADDIRERGEANQKPSTKSLRDMTDKDFAAKIGV